MSTETGHSSMDFVSQDTGASQSSVDTSGTSSSNASSYDRVKVVVDRSALKLTNQSKIFPIIKDHLQPFYKNDKKVVLEIFKSMMNQLDTMIKEEFFLLFDSCNLEELLNGFDSIKQEGQNTSRAWRPSGCPKEDVVAHLQDTSNDELKDLESIYAALLSDNKCLNECVQQMSTKIASSVRKINDGTHKWEEAALAITADNEEELIQVTERFSYVNFLEEES